MFSKRMVVIGAADLSILLGSVLIGLLVSHSGLYSPAQEVETSLQWILYVTIIMGCMVSMGLYNPDYMFNMHEAVTRLITGFLIAFVAVSLLLGFVETPLELRQALPSAMALSFGGLLMIRYIASHGTVSQFLKRRVLVLGAGMRAQRIQMEVRKKHGHCGFVPVAYIPTTPDEQGVSRVNIIDDPIDLLSFCKAAGIDEIVIAADERRGNMPIDMLLECRMAGCKITAVTDFIEREAGQVELEGLYPSWLVFSSGAARNRVERFLKRLVDIIASSALLLITLPVTALTALIIFLDDGAPVFTARRGLG